VTDPVAVLLKFAFIAVLYLFLIWVARSALKDLRRAAPEAEGGAGAGRSLPRAPLLVVDGGGGLRAGASFAINGVITIGRSPQADVQIDDPFASAAHARIFEREGNYYLEDQESTNGTYLNERRVDSRQRLRAEDTIRIGDTRFRYRQ
jgi:hypothetical protein